jgi:hypothetical protein
LVIDLLVTRRYLPDNVIHDRAAIESALTRLIADETSRINRYR